MKSLGLSEASAFLRIHPEELRKRAKAGQVPGAKVGRAWVFFEDDLAAYLRSLYGSPRQALRVTSAKEENVCHYANAAVSGALTSSVPRDNEYANLLELPTGPSPRNSTTS
jgi:hypothetical protein